MENGTCGLLTKGRYKYSVVLALPSTKVTGGDVENRG